MDDIHVIILRQLNDKELYDSCISSQRMKNICMNDPVLSQRFVTIQAKYKQLPTTRQ